MLALAVMIATRLLAMFFAVLALGLLGVGYLLAKNLPKAEEHLAALKRFCRATCEERDDLAKKIAEYKKTGGK